MLKYAFGGKVTINKMHEPFFFRRIAYRRVFSVKCILLWWFLIL